MAAILNSAILNSTILDSAILVFPLKLTHTCQDWFPPFAQKKTSLTIPSPPFAQKKLHSFIFTQLDDSSHLEFYHVGFRHLVFFSQIHSKTLSLHSDSDSNQFNMTQTHSFSLNLMMAAILNSTICTQLDDGSHLEFHHLRFSHLSFSSQTHSHLPRLVPTICTQKKFTHTSLPTICTKKTSLIHSDLTWWWQPSWILSCWIQTPCYLLSDSLKNTLTPLWLWLKLIQSDSNSFILTQLDDGSHLEFCHLEFYHLGFSHLSFSSQTHSHLPRLVPTICTKKTSLTLPSPPFAQKKLHSFIFTQLDDSSHLEFYHVGFRHLVFFSQIHSKTLSLHSDSDSN